MNRPPQVHNLAVLLKKKMSEDNCKATDLAKKLGISQSYFSELLSGDKEFSKLRTGTLRNIAAHLEIPGVVCFILAGTLHSGDFIINPDALEMVLNDALRNQLSYREMSPLEEGFSLCELSLEVKLILAAVLSSPERRAELHKVISRSMSCFRKSSGKLR